MFPLLPDLDNLISARQIFLNSEPDRKTQVFSDKMRFFAKRVNKLRNRIEDLTDDLHRRVAYDLVTKNDVILLPAFETKDMASRQDRKISSKTVRSMLGLAHYKFKETMRWMCLKYGKTLVDVNEAYTSKTMSWCGKIKKNLGGSKIISDGIIKVDRDINAARNILLKSIAVAAPFSVAFVAEKTKSCITLASEHFTEADSSVTIQMRQPFLQSFFRGTIFISTKGIRPLTQFQEQPLSLLK